MKSIKTPYFSYRLGTLPGGCRLCVKGEKSVFFITGLCSKSCFFCPISDQKKNRDVIYINEWPTKMARNILSEIRLCRSKGVGITGGDPLLRLQRTLSYIKMLKKEFGKGFHIHMYVPLELVTGEKLRKLYDAGLDEIRFHPDVQDRSHWEKLLLAKRFSWDVGVEIPVVPLWEKETKALIDFIADKVTFLNLNELELSDTNYNRILEQGYHAKDSISYGVKGSEAMAKRLLRYIAGKRYRINVHYCTCRLKDRVQLTKRLGRRIKSAKKEYDIADKDNLLVRGAIYPILSPGFTYRKKLEGMKKNERVRALAKLARIRKQLMREFEIPGRLIEVDKVKLRILTNANILLEICSQVPYKSAIVKEYPTYDTFEVEVEFI